MADHEAVPSKKDMVQVYETLRDELRWRTGEEYTARAALDELSQRLRSIDEES
jgi:hypothetical protein